jgi:hypothetical protein
MATYGSGQHRLLAVEDGGRRRRGGPDCPIAARFASASCGHKPACCGAADQRDEGHVEKCIALPKIVPASFLRDARLCGPETAYAAGEESLAQVNREIEAPKLKNLKRAGFVIFLYSLLFTSLVSFFAVMLIPDVEREKYLGNLIGGLSMFLAGPYGLRLLFHGLNYMSGSSFHW